MKYYKIFRNAELVAAEAYADPVYVMLNRNGLRIRCSSEVEAQGILCLNGEAIAQLQGKASLDVELTAVETSMMEYDEIIQQLDGVDIEDTDPEVPEVVEEKEILTRAELTERVAMLEECILEMSEIVYA